tara:strand:- start:96 stop:950 length:855 start_codon:yes stop_codon:yes gene_type:complete
MFKLLNIEDIIDKHKGTPAVIECHGPSANLNRKKINELSKNIELISIATNEWYEFEDRLKPNYWIRAHTGGNGGLSINKDLEIFNHYSEGTIPLLNCDTVDSTPLKFVIDNLKCPYLPYDNRHFDGLSCEENYKKDPEGYLAHPRNIFFKFVKDCCDTRRLPNRITMQEELAKYSNHNKHFGTSGMTVALTMIAFATLMGCNPIYLNGIDLDYFGEEGVYAKVKNGSKIMNGFTPGSQTWQGWRRDWTIKDMNIINDSAKKIGTKIINLNHNTWYGIFEKGSLQ